MPAAELHARRDSGGGVRRRDAGRVAEQPADRAGAPQRRLQAGHGLLARIRLLPALASRPHAPPIALTLHSFLPLAKVSASYHVIPPTPPYRLYCLGII